MTRRVLLDTNLLIGALDTKNPRDIEELNKLLKDENIALAISPLIRYEILRGVKWGDNETYKTLLLALNELEEFEIGK